MEFSFERLNSITIMMFAFFSIGFVSAENVYRLKPYLTECRAIFKSNVTNAEVREIMLKQDPSTDQGKCFLHCLFSKMGVMTKEGRMSWEGMTELNVKIKLEVERVANTCDKVELGEDRCENAVKFFHPFKRVADKFGFIGID